MISFNWTRAFIWISKQTISTSLSQCINEQIVISAIISWFLLASLSRKWLFMDSSPKFQKFFIVFSYALYMGLPCGSAGKEFTCNVGNLSLIPGLGRSPGEGKDYSLQYSGLENFMDYIVHRVERSQTPLSNFHFHVWYIIITI